MPKGKLIKKTPAKGGYSIPTPPRKGKLIRKPKKTGGYVISKKKRK